MNTSLFLTKSHLSPNLAITIFVSFAVSVHTSIPKQLPPLPLPLFTPSLTAATLFITTCPSLRSPGSNRFRTLLHVLLSKPPNPVASLPSYGFCSKGVPCRPWWALRWINHWSRWHMASATSDLQLPPQTQGIIAPWPVPNYTAWWQKHVCEQLAQVCYLKAEHPRFESRTFWVASPVL